MNRRTILKGGFVLAATGHSAIAELLPPSAMETREQKCARLLQELLAECRQLPLLNETMFGRSVQIPIDGKGSSARYNYSASKGQLLTVLVRHVEGDEL